MNTNTETAQDRIDTLRALQHEINRLKAESAARFGRFGRVSSTLDQIHACMDGKEWDADTLDAIAGILNQAGYEIRTAQELDP